MTAGTLLAEMQVFAPSLLGASAPRVLGTVSAPDKWWADRFLVEIEGVLLRVTRDRGQVFADIGYDGDSPRLWQFATLLSRWDPQAGLPPDDVAGLAKTLEQRWPTIRAEIEDAKDPMEVKYGPPNAP